MALTREAAIERLQGFPYERYGVRLCVLFGSLARGDAGVAADVDLGFLLAEPFDPMVKLELIAEATRRLGTDDVDVVVFNRALEASPILVARALAEGIVLRDEDQAARIALQIRALKLAEDQRHLIRIADEARRGAVDG